MSKVAIVGNASGTGTFTIASPNSNSDRTLNLPDSAGTLLHDASSLAAANLTGNVAAARITGALNATGSAPIYACRAWVNFKPNQTTIGIRGSGNVSSITDHGVGEYTVNFSTALEDANYSVVATGDDVAYGGCATFLGEAYITSSSVRFQYRGNYPADPARYDGSTFCVAVFR